ncbi:MAG: hypothetical protein KME42_19950 [Tildeniella nuda ZEHNDER 1965/U140]|jgi:peptidoglycan hydrolase CwlO-like protein|nr:hypothetical protein [Tildeniella nuda ZEHNDER 1965/U140]
MVKQRLFLGSVAFGISFGISFLTGRHLGNAIASGMTTTVAAVAASAVVDRQQHRHAHARIADLKNHIQALQQRRAEAYHAYKQLEAEQEQLAANLNSLALPPGQPQLMNSPTRSLPASLRALSWDLSAPAQTNPPIDVRPHELPTEIPAAGSPPWVSPHTSASDVAPSSDLKPDILAEATAAKRTIETNLAALQVELNQIKGHITDHRQTREKLSRELANLREEKRQLEATAKTLKGEVQDLETCRVELEQFLAYAETKKHELETGSNPLQAALKQLQAQVSSLQDELRVLEAQILDRRSQKEALEQQLKALEAALPIAKTPAKAPGLPELKSKKGSSNGSNGNGDAYSEPAIVLDTSVKQPVMTTRTTQPIQSGSTQATVTVPEPIALDKPSSDLPHEWTEFMVQLPEYELQVIKVIVEQNRPAAVLKHIAEENLTMPELLIDSINERALETIGDLLIDAGSGAGSATIVRDHLKTVKKLLKTYEYLAN